MQTGRREFIATLIGVGTGLIASKITENHAIASQPSKFDFKKPQPVDLERAAMDAYLGYYEKGLGCCHGVFKSLAVPEFKRVGLDFEIYDNIVKVMRAGKSGVADAGSICGSVLGAAFAFEWFFESKTANEMQKELHRWHTYTALPSFTPKSSKYIGDVIDTSLLQSMAFTIPKTTAYSPECHPSIAQWMYTTGYSKESPHRRERCGRLTADVAVKAGMIWNQYLAEGKFNKTSIDPNQMRCAACHDKDYIPKNDPPQYRGQSLVFDVGSNQKCAPCHPRRKDVKIHPYRRIDRRLDRKKQ